MPTYYKDFASHILELLKDNFGDGTFRTFYDGEPHENLIGQSSLPAIVVAKLSQQSKFGPTGFDHIESTYVIKLVVDKRDGFGGSDTVDLTNLRLRQLAEGRDDTTGQYLPESVVGIIRTFISLNDFLTLNPLINQQLEVKYWVVPRPGAVITDEAHITVHVTELLNVPNRV